MRCKRRFSDVKAVKGGVTTLEKSGADQNCTLMNIQNRYFCKNIRNKSLKNIFILPENVEKIKNTVFLTESNR